MGVHSTIHISREKALDLVQQRLNDNKWLGNFASAVLADISLHNCVVAAEGEPTEDDKVDEDIALAKIEGRW